MSKKFCLAAFVVFALAMPAAASGPTRFPLDFTTGPSPVFPPFSPICGSFDILESRSVTGLQLVWFDASGQPLRAVTHLQSQVTFSNSETGQTVSGFSNVEESFDLTTGALAQHGLAVTVNLPQRGKLYVQAGTISFNTITGELTFITPAFNKDFITPLCSALSQ
jgi:hypothetical protein